MYNQKEFLEDEKIINYVLRSQFSKTYIDDREQLINDCLYKLSIARSHYDEKISSYCNYAYYVVFKEVLFYLRSNKNIKVIVVDDEKNNNVISKSHNRITLEIISLDEQIDEDLCIGDLIGKEDDYNEIGLFSLIKKLIINSKNLNYKKFVKYFCLGYSSNEIYKKMKISRSLFCKYLKKFRNDLSIELAKVDYKVGC